MTTNERERVALAMSGALAVVAAVTSILSFFFWHAFRRDVPMGIGNLRGTALAVAALAVPLLVVAMRLAARGSVRARLVWLGCLAYLAYNAVMFNFAAHFNSYFLLFTTLLALSFWSLVTFVRALDPEVVRACASRVPARAVAAYLLVCAVLFGGLWLQAVVPATVNGTMPMVIEEAGLTQNTVWVLDFAFTFPLMIIGSVWLWKRRPWGYVLGGMMTIMLTIETAGIAVDQFFGHLHDPSAPLGAVPPMIVFTAAGLVFSALFLRGLERDSRAECAKAERASRR